MDIPKLATLKRAEIYQQKLDAIDKKYSFASDSIDVKKDKFIEKCDLYKQWFMDLRQVTDEAENLLNKLKSMFEMSKGIFQKFRTDLQQLHDDIERVRDELENEDSGIGEMLTLAAQIDDDIPDQLDFESRTTALAEAIDKSSRDLDELSSKMTQLDQMKADITTQFTELQQKYDDFSAEMQRELYTTSTD